MLVKQQKKHLCYIFILYLPHDKKDELCIKSQIGSIFNPNNVIKKYVDKYFCACTQMYIMDFTLIFLPANFFDSPSLYFS